MPAMSRLCSRTVLQNTADTADYPSDRSIDAVTVVVDDGDIDTDGDSTIDRLDTDDDNDGILDTVDAMRLNPGCISGATTQDGSAANPYCIDTLAELQSIASGFCQQLHCRPP